MSIYIIDSNVIFSAALNISNPIGRFIMASNRLQVSFYAPEYLRQEIEKHLPKLINISKLEQTEIRRIVNLLYSRISFISDELIPFEYYQKAVPFVRDIDLDDLVFVALAEYLKTDLWTGDIRLYNGLKSKGYARVVTFKELRELYGLT